MTASCPPRPRSLPLPDPARSRARRLPRLWSALLGALALGLPGPAAAEDRLLAEMVGFSGAIAFAGTAAPGMVIAAVRDGETAFAGFGETARGNGIAPTVDTMMRVASISKVFCGDVLAGLIAEPLLGMAAPVEDYMPAEVRIPQKDGRSLTVGDLVTQTSGLPREFPRGAGTPGDPYAGHDVAAIARAMQGDPFLFAPGTGALYSNWGFDLLGLAIAGAAGMPYAEALAARVLAPRGMADTVFNPRPGDAGRLMQGHGFDGAPLPFVPTPETMECASGLYTTAADMQKWLAWHVAPGPGDVDGARRLIDHAAWRWRDGLSPALGLDDGGHPMDAMALGWVVILPEGDRPMILHKSGGRQGMFTYVAIAPARRIGVFAAINQFDAAGFELMVKTANNLIARIAPR